MNRIELALERYMENAEFAEQFGSKCPEHIANRVIVAQIEWLKLYRENHGDGPVMGHESVTRAIEWARTGIQKI